MPHLNVPNLNQLGCELIFHRDPNNAPSPTRNQDFANRVKTEIVYNTTQTMLYYIGNEDWDTLRRKQVEVGAFVIGIGVLGCCTIPNVDGPLEIAVPVDPAKVILDAVQDVGYTFEPSLPVSMWPVDRSKLLEMEMNCANTPFANRNMFTPIDHPNVFVANVYRFRHTNQRSIHVIATNYHPLGLVLDMQLTAHMCFVTGSHVYMLYPHTTLEKRIALDVTRPLGHVSTLSLGSTANETLLVNPVLTAFDMANPDTELNGLTRWAGDKYTLMTPLPYAALPDGDGWPGSRAMVTATSWQARCGPDNIIKIETMYYRNRRLAFGYMLSPPVVLELDITHPHLRTEPPLPLPANIEDCEDAEFVVVLESLIDRIQSPSSPYIYNARLVSANMRNWCGSYTSYPAALAPSPAVANTAFRVLNSLPLQSPKDVRVLFSFEPSPRLWGKIWTAMSIFHLQDPDSSDEQKQVIVRLNDIAMTVRFITFNKNVNLEIDI
ncbi:hypothetical protein VNI00_010557 [Paramarasmius palmivorus]|uniref:Major capsid protein n=1 Tax=Paramarasmius palmivorus TaxID=297713 RepID=A0AAW0CM16_9AGAR